MPTHVETLDNGLKVILRPIPDTKALSTWVVYRIGSRNEVPGMTGSTHWVEHMLFKGGGKLGKGDIDKMISRLGGKMNAFTDTDYTMYFETIPTSSMDTALMIESERMRNAAFDPKEVEAERTVVISEREGAENQPDFAVEEELWGLAFHVHPYHWTAIGYKQDLATLDREPLYRHYLRYYAPNNASLILVGGFDPAVAMQRVREAFAPLKPETPPDPLRLSEPEQHGERRSDLERPGPADLLSVGWHIPAANHEDTAALVLLSTVLGGWRGIVPFAAGDWRPRSNRLYRALVDARLATDVGVRQEMKLDPALLIASVTLARGASLDRVEAVLDREVEALRKTPPPKSELARARQQVRAWARYEQDGVTFQGILLGAGEGLGSWDFGEALLAFQGRCTRETAAETVRILVECLSQPTFPPKEIERVRGELLNDLRIEADDTRARAFRTLSRLVFPKDHPYGRDPKGGEARVRRIRRADIVSFHEAHVSPEGLILAATGDVDRALLEDAIAAPLSRLRGDEGGPPAIPPPPPHRPGSESIPMPHKTQVDIAIGAPGVPRRHADYYALNLANLLFGRIGLYGRLGRNLRDEQGGSLIVSLERNAEVASELHRMEYYGLGMDFLERYPELIGDLTGERVRDVARKYFLPSSSSMVIAGPVGRARFRL